jgi:sulfur carrier protein ThiS
MSGASPSQTVRIHLEYAAVLHLPGLPNGGEVELSAGSTVADLLRRGGVREDQLRYVIPIVDGTRRRIDTVLEAGDRLVLRLPLGGG